AARVTAQDARGGRLERQDLTRLDGDGDVEGLDLVVDGVVRLPGEVELGTLVDDLGLGAVLDLGHVHAKGAGVTGDEPDLADGAVLGRLGAAAAVCVGHDAGTGLAL